MLSDERHLLVLLVEEKGAEKGVTKDKFLVSSKLRYATDLNRGSILRLAVGGDG